MFVDHTATFAMPTPAGALCFVCGTKSVRYAGDACSRRCDWLHRGCCPQCGRGRHSNGTFCGPQCAGESIHANWCGACGVRQLNHGSASCGVPHCEAAMHSMIARNVPTYVPHHHHQQHPAPHGYTIHHGIQAPPQLPTRIGAGPSPYHHPNHHRAAVPVVIPPRNRGFVPHSNLAPNDKLVASLRHQLPSNSELLGAIKVGGPAEDRKRYVANRNRLETELNEWCGIGAPKYGHGGEGNEHRRILSLRSECGSRCLDGKHCGSLSCEVCVVLDGGLRREAVGRNVFTTWHSARDVLASPVTTEDCSNVEGVRVLMVCRVAVGHPAIAEGPEAANEMLCSPCPPEGAHTVVVRRRSDVGTSTNPTAVAPSVETVEVFDDAGIDPLVLLIVSHHQ